MSEPLSGATQTNPEPDGLQNIPDFGPSDRTDGRQLGDFKSKYPSDAWRVIWVEAAYLSSLLIIIPVGLLFLWLDGLKDLFSITDQDYDAIMRYGTAWLGGCLGGTLFDLKWLYHSVARQLWHLDRRLWRLLTPHISGGLAFAVVALISSGLFRVFDRRSVESLSLVVGVAFLVGYFSDSAIAKLTEVAETLFGPNRGKEKHREASPQEVNGERSTES